MIRSLKRQQGVVIVVALFFVALIATMSYLMMSRLQRDTVRTSLLVHDTQAELYAQGSIDWAMEQLRDNLTRKKPDKPVDIMPIQSPKNEINGYIVSSTITDMQARFNLNNLITPEAQLEFKRLIHIIDPEITEQKAQDIAMATMDWITPGQQQNEYNKYYMSLSPPYRAAHRNMVSANELQLVKGMTSKLYKALQPYVAALPAATKINALTAPAAVIAALSPSMTLETGKAIEKARTEVKISNTDAFLNLDLVKNHGVQQERVTVESNYFLIETTVAIEKQQVVLYTLVERTGNEGKSAVRVVWQSKGVEG